MPSGSGRFNYNGIPEGQVIFPQIYIDEKNTYLNLIEMVSPEKDCIEAFNAMRTREVISLEDIYEEQRTIRQGRRPEGDESHGDLLEDFFGKKE